MMIHSALVFLAAASIFVTGCSSAQKARKEQRDKVAASSKLYCDFVNGELFPADVEVALNLEMAKKCDSERAFTITNYKTPAENNGVVFCCSIANAGKPTSAAAPAPAPAPAAKDKKDELE